MEHLYEEVSEYVLSVRGTMSGEHGDGLLRTPHIERQYGPDLYHLFEEIKAVFDPKGLLNPGKKVGPQDPTGSLREALRYGTGYRTYPRPTTLHFPPGKYESEVEKCHGCAQCKGALSGTMCPVYRATRLEAASPRAKANLLRHILSGALDSESTYGSHVFKTITDYCILCGMCAVECPSRVNIPKLMLEAKAKYRTLHRGLPAEAVLSRAEAVSRLGSTLAPLSNRLASRGRPALAWSPSQARPPSSAGAFRRCRGLVLPDSSSDSGGDRPVADPSPTDFGDDGPVATRPCPTCLCPAGKPSPGAAENRSIAHP